MATPTETRRAIRRAEPAEMSSRLFIVRHGNTFDKGDVVTRVGGRTDLPLSSSGRAQADALARHFAGDGIAFTSARTSPLSRTRATAEAILAAQAAPPELETALFLREIDYGPDENRPEPEVIARIGEDALRAWEEAGAPPPGWRVDPEAIVGNWRTLMVKLATQPGDHLVVTSNGVARFALWCVERGRAGAKLSTGGYGVIRLAARPDSDPDEATIETWNIRPGKRD
ncbi:MAG: phosphoglycerate mutase family protein [Hyphomonadaceae bacterium]